jgi:hypothetical protein
MTNESWKGAERRNDQNNVKAVGINCENVCKAHLLIAYNCINYYLKVNLVEYLV